jgi:osmotically-inducible protein OsmY
MTHMRSIFISYRREDAEGQAGRLCDDLTAQFGEDSVFMDVVDIEPGRDFRRVIDQHVASCGVLLAVIGKGWLDAKDKAGRRRLDDPNDFVRLETASALKRDIPVIPVLVQGTGMPREDQLPEDLKEFAYRNAVELTHARWDSDVQILIKALRRSISAGSMPEEQESSKVGGSQEPAPTISLGMTRTDEESEARSAEPLVTPRPQRVSRRVILVASVTMLALLFGAYKIYDYAQKVAEERVAAEKAAAAKTAADRAAAGQAAEQQKAAAKTAAQRAAAEKAAAAKTATDWATTEKAAAAKAAAEKPGEVTRKLDPAEIQRLVEQKLRQKGYDITVRVGADCVVTLIGVVQTQQQKHEAVSLARVEGVGEVKSNINVRESWKFP